MAAYLGRFQAPPGKVTWGLLAYPFDPAKPDIAPAEKNSPWNLENGKQLGFASLPHDAAVAVVKLRHILGCFGS
jgi:5-methylcytosine-specific restriction enzyme subunit McrC